MHNLFMKIYNLKCTLNFLILFIGGGGQRITAAEVYFLPPDGFLECNSGCEAWWQVPLPLSHLSGPVIELSTL